MNRKWKIGILVTVLFGIESIFPNFFPEYLFADTYIFVPRFLFLFLILLAIFYDWKKAVFLAIGLGLLMDIVFIEILGIYTFWYPAIIYLVSKVMKVLHSHLAIVAMVALLAITVLEYGIYGMFYIIRIHDFPLVYFLEHRLIPTLILNFIVYLIMSYPMKKKLTHWKKAKEEEEGMFQS